MRCSETAVLVAALATACTCAGSESGDAGVDAGSDAGPEDLGSDSPRDTGLVDSGIDAWALDGGWSPVPGAPTGCLEIASPELVAATTWAIERCPDRAGCRRIPAPAGSTTFFVERAHGAQDGARGLVAIVHSSDEISTEEWIVDDQGRTISGFRGPQIRPEGEPCWQGEYDVSATSFALLTAGPDPSPTVTQGLFRGAIGSVPGRVTDLDAPSGGRAFAQEIRIDTGRVGAWMSSQVVQAVEVDGSISTIADIGASCSLLDVVGDAIFVLCAPRLPTVYAQLPGGPLEVLLDPTIGNNGLDSDGTTMAWLRYRLVDGGGTVELWTSPHAVHAADVQERMVASVPVSSMGYPYELRVGFGYAAVLEQPDVIGVYRLSDGARATLQAPAGEQWRGFVHWIGPTEIAASSGPPTALTNYTALIFVRIDSLTFVPP